MPWADTLMVLLAAWLLMAGASLWSRQLELGLEKPMLLASLRGLLQLIALAFALHWIFGIESHIAQISVITAFCVLAAWNSAGHAHITNLPKWQVWLSISLALMMACVFTLPWLAFSGAVDNSTRVLIPIGSMVAANGMNAVSLMLHSMRDDAPISQGIKTAMIPSVDMLKMVGLVHMPGIFVGMILAGAAPLDAASAQLVVLYMIVASNLAACIVSFLMISYFRKMQACD